LGRFSAGIAHEIRNPLTAIRGFSQMILKQGSPEDKAYAEKILREQERVEKLVRDMLVYARPRTAEKKSINLYEFAHSILERTHRLRWTYQKTLYGTWMRSTCCK